MGVMSPTSARVGAVTRRGVPVCPSDVRVADAAAAMTRAHSHTAIVSYPDGSRGVLTDGDLRRRVVAAGLGSDVPLSAVASTPAVTVAADLPVRDAAGVALSAGVRRLVVLDAGGAVLGVVDDADLMSPALRPGIAVRAEIARAADADALIAACAQLTPIMVSLCDSRVPTSEVMMIRSVVVTAAVRRAAELLGDDASSWLVSGSVARRESALSSDVETARVAGDGGASGEKVHALLAQCGLIADPNNATAASRRFVRTREEWSTAVDGWARDPFEDTGLVMLSLALDARPVVPGSWGPASAAVSAMTDAPRSRTLLLREATENRPRVSMRDRMFRRAEVVDVKAGILAPIVDIARWAGVSAGYVGHSTLARLAAGADASVLSADDAAVLAESFEVVQRIRLRHQCDAVAAGDPVDDLVRPSELTPLDRSLVGTAAREVSGVVRASAYLAG
ncbi:hypothetical protein ASG56_07235 [Rhodococcus sp. Leaf7]|nr:hypothetical protein ASG56_07235 [Rhodococcus sp. Leaf7]KQU42829.1 hypothetical protein ASG64_07235 [Rhodococcus sp. Leaf247]